MKIIIVPILDISYYLPEFSGFNPDNLFNSNGKNKDKLFKLTIDMDTIFNSFEEKNLQLNNDKQNKENFLRNIYIRSNPELAKGFLKLANHLDFGKEEEFFFIENNPENIKNNKRFNKMFDM